MYLCLCIYSSRDNGINKKLTIKRVIAVVSFILLINPFTTAVTKAVSYQQEPIEYTDSIVIQKTNPGDGIFIDLYGHSTVYLTARGRMMINRAGFILPWYMDWYEDWNIEDLQNKKPDYVIWDTELVFTDNVHFASRMEDYVKGHYTQDDIATHLWIKNT